MNEKRYFLKSGCMIRLSDKIYVSVFSFIAAVFFSASQGVLYSVMFFYAVMIHELAHIVFLAYFGGKIQRVSVYPFGIDILADTHALSYKKEIVVALAGCSANLTHALIGCIIFYFSPSPYLLFFIISHLAPALFNLIPLSCFDGGRAVRLMLYDSFDIDTAYRLWKLCDLLSSLFLLWVCFLSVLYSGINLSVLILAVYASSTIIYMCITKRSRLLSAP